jgi:hypothetical protein
MINLSVKHINAIIVACTTGATLTEEREASVSGAALTDSTQRAEQ